ncbi:P-loop containing nucleoside triphosphate hydrolase protein [Tothia fuscella]|uniref:P-loop containing nucleoside triphosphate hydrolase protein n=1 Tax=Tothia fuscella TaxID=1048955 RepID=A0A9P4TYK0_9PEZI|nr:P-loop containing nucleoside triphosphate hydrolase protein [Tothia fuscella]
MYPQLDWTKLSGPMMTSAKTMAIKSQVLEWRRQEPKCKTIIFTQFTGLLQILNRICKVERWKHSEISGKATMKNRNKIIKEFNKPKGDVEILIATQGTCGTGLNLTAATKVLIVESWWNEAMDQQAFCRVWRIGQTKETELVRLCVDKSMDSRVLQIQQRKIARFGKIKMGKGLSKYVSSTIHQVATKIV